MPLVANTELPAFERLKQDGETILSGDFALEQEIRELHIGLLNIMPDKALQATERQFFRLIGESNQIAQFYVHPFTLDELERSPEAKVHVDSYYSTFDQLKEQGLDALIITGANVVKEDLADEEFWEPLGEVVKWAYENVTSTLCSCLATHVVMQYQYDQKRTRIPDGKRWGVYPHWVTDQKHPLVTGVNTRFDVPHSRFNQIDRSQFFEAGLKVLAESVAGVHLAVSPDGFRQVFFQGHPEYDAISLLKEYKREVGCFVRSERETYPPFPEHYFRLRDQAILEEHQEAVLFAVEQGTYVPEFPEEIIIPNLDNTWHDTAEAVINNWIGKVYQTTNSDRRLPFMESVDPKNPLSI
ncbi:MAG: homoserine O-succinyltransferase [Gammaproteobacteria bacterium]